MNIYTERLIQLRHERKYSQKYISEYLKTTQQQVSKYEKEIQEIPIRHIISLARLYNISLDYITGLTNEKRGI